MRFQLNRKIPHLPNGRDFRKMLLGGKCDHIQRAKVCQLTHITALYIKYTKRTTLIIIFMKRNNNGIPTF